jgi:hypothetical protein
MTWAGRWGLTCVALTSALGHASYSLCCTAHRAAAASVVIVMLSVTSGCVFPLAAVFTLSSSSSYRCRRCRRRTVRPPSSVTAFVSVNVPSAAVVVVAIAVVIVLSATIMAVVVAAVYAAAADTLGRKVGVNVGGGGYGAQERAVRLLEVSGAGRGSEWTDIRVVAAAVVVAAYRPPSSYRRDEETGWGWAVAIGGNGRWGLVTASPTVSCK